MMEGYNHDKKKHFFYQFIIVFCSVVTFFIISKPAMADEKKVEEVTSFEEFKAAAGNPNITAINLKNNISFSNNISIANRDLVINGNADKFYQIDTRVFSIIGKSGTQNNSIRISNANIISSSNSYSDRPFIKAPSNWNVYANDVVYKGPVFADVRNGQLVFESDNNLQTTFENADVKVLNFAENSNYVGIAADLTKSPGFKFSGNYENGKAAGTVEVSKNASVSLSLAPNHTESSYYYPAFYGKYYKLKLDEQSSLAIDAAGTAIKYNNQIVYKEKPSIYISKNASLLLNSRGGGQYPALDLDNATDVQVQEGTLKITGTSPLGVIKTERTGTQFLLNKPKSYLFKNKQSNAPIFNKAKNTSLKFLNIDMSVWNKIGGEYDGDPNYNWAKMNLSTVINDSSSSNTESSDKDLESNFQIFDYGCISGEKAKISCPVAPTFNPVNDQDTQLTGTGNYGCKIIAKNRETSEVLGETIVGNDNRWIIHMNNPQKQNTIIDIIQDCQIEDCDLITVTQKVTHLSSETVNFFKLGYWQEYGLILEGSVDNADWKLTNANEIHKTLYLANEQEAIVATIDPIANTDWYQTNKFNGYQVILDNSLLTSLKPGMYKLKIGIKIDGTDIDEVQDVNISNTTYTPSILYPGPYHQIFTGIESRDYLSNIRISTVNNQGIGYIKVESL